MKRWRKAIAGWLDRVMAAEGRAAIGPGTYQATDGSHSFDGYPVRLAAAGPMRASRDGLESERPDHRIYVELGYRDLVLTVVLTLEDARRLNRSIDESFELLSDEVGYFEA